MKRKIGCGKIRRLDWCNSGLEMKFYIPEGDFDVIGVVLMFFGHWVVCTICASSFYKH